MKIKSLKNIAKILVACSFLYLAGSFAMTVAATPEPTPEQMDAFLDAQAVRANQIDRILSRGY